MTYQGNLQNLLITSVNSRRDFPLIFESLLAGFLSFYRFSPVFVSIFMFSFFSLFMISSPCFGELLVPSFVGYFHGPLTCGSFKHLLLRSSQKHTPNSKSQRVVKNQPQAQKSARSPAQSSEARKYRPEVDNAGKQTEFAESQHAVEHHLHTLLPLACSPNENIELCLA